MRLKRWKRRRRRSCRRCWYLRPMQPATQTSLACEPGPHEPRRVASLARVSAPPFAFATGSRVLHARPHPMGAPPLLLLPPPPPSRPPSRCSWWQRVQQWAREGVAHPASEALAGREAPPWPSPPFAMQCAPSACDARRARVPAVPKPAPRRLFALRPPRALRARAPPAQGAAPPQLPRVAAARAPRASARRSHRAAERSAVVCWQQRWLAVDVLGQ